MPAQKRTCHIMLLDLLYDIIGSLLYSIGIYTFAKLHHFALGGISGLSLIANYLWNAPIGTMTLLLNIPLVFISYRIVGRRFLLKTARSMLFNTIFLDVIFPMTKSYEGSPLLAAMYSGIFMGAGLAFFFLHGSSSGGIDLLTMSIRTKRPTLSIGALTMTFDFIIILLGWPVFGSIDAVLYGLINAFVTSVMIDKIMYGIGACKLAIIITTKADTVAFRIAQTSGRGSTVIQARGSYTGTERSVLLCACSGSETFRIQSCIYSADPDAFVMLTETSEVFGNGFRPSPSTKTPADFS
ncbi:MAG: YitT family protein [Lachnospiraceae bacterium]